MFNLNEKIHMLHLSLLFVVISLFVVIVEI